jgi:hypothetical protein
MDPKYAKLTEANKDTRFRPGQSGNPGGRPKIKTLSQAYRSQLEQVNPADPAGRTFAECIAENLVKLAAKGNVQACIELADRVEGKITLAVAGLEDDDFAEKSIEELESELDRARAERLSGESAPRTPDSGSYKN